MIYKLKVINVTKGTEQIVISFVLYNKDEQFERSLGFAPDLNSEEIRYELKKYLDTFNLDIKLAKDSKEQEKAELQRIKEQDILKSDLEKEIK